MAILHVRLWFRDMRTVVNGDSFYYYVEEKRTKKNPANFSVNLYLKKK